MTAPAPSLAYRLQPVETAAHRRLFLELVDTFYQGNAQYVRPNNQEVEAVFDPKRNKLFGLGGAVARWILLDEAGRPAGRIAAFVNPTVQAKEKQTVGGFGFFECVDDQAAATLLLDQARQWLEGSGMQAMDGPINFGERDRFWGLLVQGFDRLPVYGMFYHPPYYQRLLETYGLQVYFRQYTYMVDVTVPQHPRMEAKYRAFNARTDVVFARADKRNLDKIAHDFHYIYSRAWGGHSGVSDLTEAQTRKIVDKMSAVMDENLMWFAYVSGEPTALFIAIPGLNQIFRQTGPNLNGWGKLKFLLERRRWEKRPDKLCYGIVYGVIPAFQGAGLDVALSIAAQPHIIARGYKEMEMSWIGDFNPKMMAICRLLGSDIVKIHHTYRMYFDPTHPFERSPIIGRGERKAGGETAEK